jgi:hypothetical protein
MDIRVPIPAIIQPYVKSDETLWAHVVSLALNPPLVWSVAIYPIALYIYQSQTEAFIHATVFSTLVCWIPGLFVALMVKLGKIGDLHMQKSRERYVPYAISIVGAIAVGLILDRLQAHPILLILSLVTFVQLTLMLIGTFFDHISTHAMAISSISAAWAIVFGLEVGFAMIPLILLVVLARLVLNRHTGFQIMVGILVGALTPFLVIFGLSLVL